MIKRIIIKILSGIFKLIVKVLPPAVVHNSIENIADKEEVLHDGFFTYHIRPKQAVSCDRITNNIYNNVGIVIQGPLVKENNFTLETVKIYQKYYPKVHIAVSTWIDSDIDYVELIKGTGVKVLLNDKPKMSGALNSNYQIISSINGIKELMSLTSVEYILKTRADQRLYSPNALDLFVTLLDKYPAIDEKQNKRILSVNFTTLKYRPFTIGDMCMFGSKEDIYKYWNIPTDNRTLNVKETVNKTVSELIEMNVGETFYCKSYLESRNITLNNTINDSWRIYRKYFIVIDYELVDLFWFKYDRIKEFKHRYYKPHMFDLFTYENWLSKEILVDEHMHLHEKDGNQITYE